MNVEQICLKTVSLNLMFAARSNYMRTNNELVDLTIILADGTQFMAHKVILCVASEAFNDFLSVLPPGYTIIELGYTRPDIFSLLLQFIYAGEVTMISDVLPMFLELATKLKIKSLYTAGEYSHPGNKQMLEMGISFCSMRNRTYIEQRPVVENNDDNGTAAEKVGINTENAAGNGPSEDLQQYNLAEAQRRRKQHNNQIKTQAIASNSHI